MKSLTSLLPTLVIALTATLAAGPIVTVESTKGKSLSAELLSVSKDKITVKRISDKRVVSIPKNMIEASSLAAIEKTAADLPPTYPELEADVVVNKRRKKVGYWTAEQTISTTVKLKNRDYDIPLEGAKGYVFIIGQNKSSTSVFKILGKSTFDVSIKPGGDLEHSTPKVITQYDSDNEGYGNIGGYQYEGYVLLVLGEKNSVILTKSSDSSFRKALEENVTLPAKMAKYPVQTKITESLLPVPGAP